MDGNFAPDSILNTGDQHRLENAAEGKAAPVAEPCPPMARPALAYVAATHIAGVGDDVADLEIVRVFHLYNARYTICSERTLLRVPDGEKNEHSRVD